MLTRSLQSACVVQRALTHLAAGPSPRCGACCLRAVCTSICAKSSVHSTAAAPVAHDATHNAAERRPAQEPLLVTEWSGLPEWRSGNVDTRRQWGRLYCEEGQAAAAAEAAAIELPGTLAECACLVLRTADPELKSALSHRIWDAHKRSPLPRGAEVGVRPPDTPSRPAKPELVSPKQVPSQKASPLPLNVYQLLNLAHVELNAIDLAWDTVARFAHVELPEQFFDDFAHVADDESRHFGWCSQRLNDLGHRYGDMPAHGILWQGAQASAGDIGARLAIVPLGAEARGLDAAPRLVQRLRSANDHPTAAIVDLIGAQEKAHVAVGVHWFSRLTAALDLDTAASFRGWVSTLCPDLLQGRMNHESRAEVGLQRTWYDRNLWPEGEELLLPATDLTALKLRLAALLDDCSDVAAYHS